MTGFLDAPVISSGGIDTGDIGHSLRCRSAASAYLSRTPSAGSQTTWTLSFWVKRGLLSYGGSAGITSLFGWRHSVAGQSGALCYLPGDTIQLSEGATTYRITNAVKRDPTSHEHIVLVWDTTNATQASRCRIYSNGVEFTYSTAVAISLNATLNANTAVIHTLGADFPTSGVRDFFDGYLSRVAFVDGSALTPSSFGYLNTEINEWVSKSQSQVKAVVDAGGTNSFMLDFDNGTSLTTLGYDKSSKGNNWTCNNISLTAGTTYDWMLDVPGNSYAVLNSLFRNSSLMSEGTLYFDKPAIGWATGQATIQLPAAKTYFEATAVLIGGANSGVYIGVATATAAQDTYQVANQWSFGGSGGTLRLYDQTTLITPAGSSAAGDILQVAYNGATGYLWFGKNNTWYDSSGGTSGNPSTNSNPTMVIPGGTAVFPCAVCYANGLKFTFGQRPFTYTPPTGFKALCQANLPDPAILNPTKHHNVYLLDLSVSRSFTCDWDCGTYDTLFAIKARDGADSWFWVDTLRGLTKYLQSNNTNAEATFSGSGVTVSGNTVTLADTTAFPSDANDLYVVYAWKMGKQSERQTNTSGTITSTVSANVVAGQSMVSYTGTGANGTVGHGLGKTPKFFSVKMRDVGWAHHGVYHVHSGGVNQGHLYAVALNLTVASSRTSIYWNDTAPTSTVFSIGTDGVTNNPSSPAIAYCFAEIDQYSKFTSYTGNGSADGPYVNLGFKARSELRKNASAAYDWIIHDSARNQSNVCDLTGGPSSNVSEQVGILVDICGIGSKVRSTNNSHNGSGNTIITASWASVAGKYSNAR